MRARGTGRRWIAVMASISVIVGIAGVIPPAAAETAARRSRLTGAGSSRDRGREAADRETGADPRRARPGLARLPGQRPPQPAPLHRATPRSRTCRRRAPKLRSDLTSGYVTLGAGNKAVGVGPVADGSGIEPDGAALRGRRSRSAPDRAGPVFTRRTGRSEAEGLVHLGISETVAANRDSVFGAKVGALGDTLKTAGYNRAVIANGDGSDVAQPGEDTTRHRRDAVAALMTGDGTVPAGDVSDDLLIADPTAPFGVRLDHDRVEADFTAQWRDRSVVLVEASDLVRADAYQRGDDTRSAASRCAGRRWNGPTSSPAVCCARVDPQPGRRRAPRNRARPGAGCARGRRGAGPRHAAPACCAPARRSEPGSCSSWTSHRQCSAWSGSSRRTRCGAARSRSRSGTAPPGAAARSSWTRTRRPRFRAEIVDKVAAAFIGLECGLIAVAVCSSTGVARRVTRRRPSPRSPRGPSPSSPPSTWPGLLPLHDWGLACVLGLLADGDSGAGRRGAPRRPPAPARRRDHRPRSDRRGARRRRRHGKPAPAQQRARLLARGGRPVHRVRERGLRRALRGCPPARGAARPPARRGSPRRASRPRGWESACSASRSSSTALRSGARTWAACLSLVPAFGVTAALLLGWRLRAAPATC